MDKCMQCGGYADNGKICDDCIDRNNRALSSTIDENGQRTQDSFSPDIKLLKRQSKTMSRVLYFSLDIKLLKRQSKTMSRVLYHAHKGLGYVITPADRESLEGVFEMLNSVLDRVES
jgi:hypothetical protein